MSDDDIGKEEMWGIGQALKQGLTRAEFEEMWIEFVARKKWGMWDDEQPLVIESGS